jgi:hypothetical protein
MPQCPELIGPPVAEWFWSWVSTLSLTQLSRAPAEERALFRCKIACRVVARLPGFEADLDCVAHPMAA